MGPQGIFWGWGWCGWHGTAGWYLPRSRAGGGDGWCCLWRRWFLPRGPGWRWLAWVPCSAPIRRWPRILCRVTKADWRICRRKTPPCIHGWPMPRPHWPRMTHCGSGQASNTRQSVGRPHGCCGGGATTRCWRAQPLWGQRSAMHGGGLRGASLPPEPTAAR